MAPKLDRRTFLALLPGIASACSSITEKKPLPAGVPDDGFKTKPEIKDVESAEKFKLETQEGKIYEVDMSDDFVPYPISEFSQMIYTVPVGKDDIRSLLELEDNGVPVSHHAFINDGAGYRVKVNLREEYLARTKNEANLKYGVLPIFSNIKKRFKHFAEIKDEYDKKEDIVLDDIKVINSRHTSMQDKRLVDEHEGLDLESRVSDGGMPASTKEDIDRARKRIAQVQNIQELLKIEDLYDGDIDGLYGISMRRAVRRFQKNNNLQADGGIGKETAEWLSPSTRTGLEIERVIDTLDHRVYYATFVLDDDDRKTLTKAVAEELGIMKEGDYDFKGTIDFFDKFSFDGKGKWYFSPKQGFILDIPENYKKGMKLEVDVYKNEKDHDGKSVPRKDRDPMIVLYQHIGKKRKELLRTRTVVGGYNTDHDDCTVNPLDIDEPIPKGWRESGISSDGEIRYIERCEVKEFETPSTDKAFLNYLVIGPSWIFPAWQDLSDIISVRRQHIPGFLNAFGPYHMPVSDIDRDIPKEHAWNTAYNTSDKFSGIAMHSTNSPSSIYRQGAGSHGCMRMNNVKAGKIASFLMHYIPKRDDIEEMTDKGIIGRERGLAIVPFDQDYAPKLRIVEGPAPKPE